MARLYSQAEFSRLAGVTEAAITKACKNALAGARVGRRIDADHPAAKKYLASKGVRAPSPTAPPRAAPPPPSSSAPPPPATTPSSPARPAQRKDDSQPLRSSPPAAQTDANDVAPVEAQRKKTARSLSVVRQVVDDVSGVGDLTIREVVQRFGTVTAFRDWLTSLKQIEDIREKRLRNEESDGRLIKRDLVKAHVFGMLEAYNRRLLNDTTKTLTRRLYANANSGVAIEESERMVRDQIGSQLDEVKKKAAKVLRNA